LRGRGPVRFLPEVCEGTAMLSRLLAFVLLALPLAGCEVGLFFGGLPSNDACREAESLPGQPIGTDCLDTLGP
jgi:hypothetical protein